MKDKKAIVGQIWLVHCAISKWIDLIKWQLNSRLCNFGLKHTCEFEITCMISDHIALHSLQLTLLITSLLQHLSLWIH